MNQATRSSRILKRGNCGAGAPSVRWGAVLTDTCALRFLCRDYAFDSLVNYGALPQTWEDPDHVDPVTRYSGGSPSLPPTPLPCPRLTPCLLAGDNDPLDVVEIGERVVAQGTILRVRRPRPVPAYWCFMTRRLAWVGRRSRFSAFWA